MKRTFRNGYSKIIILLYFVTEYELKERTMPRKPKFTREEVLDSAFEVARKHGLEAVSAASVAANMGYTGSSLFTHFNSMDEIRKEVLLMAKQKAEVFFKESIDYFPAFKELGIRWIRFAKEEPNLYRMLFAGNPFHHTENVETEFGKVFEPIRKEIEKTFNISEYNAKRLMSGCITLSTGIAMSIINGFCEDDTEERLSEELSNMCIGMVLLFKVQDDTFNMEQAKRLASATKNKPVKT